MTVPAIAAARFAAGCGLGMLLGIWYDFLRPLGAKRYALRDLAFLGGFCWAWMQLMFGFCRGDLRPGAFFSLLLGFCLWQMTAGRLVRPLFFGFWRMVGAIFAFLWMPFKKILKK